MIRIKYKKIAVCVLFFLVLWGFYLVDKVSPDKIYSDWEKRLLAQKPQVESADILDGSYKTAYEKWLTDQFFARDWWVGVKTRCEIVLGKKEIQGIYLGKDGYLFADSKETTDWDQLERAMQEQFGVNHVSRIHAPHAGTILIEKLPYGLSFSEHEKDAVWQNLYDHREKPIYYQTDHHWTMLGAYYAYEAWAIEQQMTPILLDDLKVQTIKEDFLGTHYGKIHYANQPDKIELYDPQIQCTVIYDLGEATKSSLYQAQYLDTEDAYRFFLDGNHALIQIQIESEIGQKGGHLVVLKDSFANCLVPFLTAHYEKITVIDPRHFRADIGEWLKGQDVTNILIIAQDTIKAVW